MSYSGKYSTYQKGVEVQAKRAAVAAVHRIVAKKASSKEFGSAEVLAEEAERLAGSFCTEIFYHFKLVERKAPKPRPKKKG